MHPLEDVSNIRYILRPPAMDPTCCFDMSSLFATHAQDLSCDNKGFPPITSSSVKKNESSSDADETVDEQRRRLINERKRRRMISNRESARRSRMRKQKHLDELWLQVKGLLGENQRLVEEINRVVANHDHLLLENLQLRNDKSKLAQTLRDLGVAERIFTLEER